jgi:site-specific recombinase XerD
MTPFRFDPVIEGYLSYLTDVRRQTPNTVKDVRCTLKRVCVAMAQRRPDVPLWHLCLEDYIRWLQEERDQGRNGRVLCKNISHLRGLLDYAWRSGRSDRNVLDGFQLQDDQQRRPPTVLSVKEAHALITACGKATREDREERAIVLLLYGCGVRTSELCQLNVQDVDRERRELHVLRGKGDRQRVIPVPEGVFPELLAYLLERGGKRGALFRTAAKHRRITGRHVGDVVRRAAERARLATVVTPKVLRHSYATHLMDRGVDLAVIASLMGHRSPAETGVYLHVLGDQTRNAVDCLRNPEGGATQ